MTQWAFGFGGWIGVFGGFFLFLNVPHNYSALLLLLSPWLGAISLYLLMFMTFSWMNVCAQVTASMVKQEIVVAVLTSFVGVLIVAIARFLIEMERGHRTPAQAAAEESAAAATIAPLPTSPLSEYETETAAADSDSDANSDSDIDSDTDTDTDTETETDTDTEPEPEIEHENSSKEDTVKSPTVESNDVDREDDEDREDTGDEASEDTGDEASEDTGENADSESSLNKARTDSSYENIKTPQLSGIKEVTVSPIPTADV